MARIAFIDKFRGILILLVVIGHLIFSIYENSDVNSSLATLLLPSRMPMFIFISGFVSYKINYQNDVFVRKIKGALIPSVLVGLIYVVVFELDAKELFCSNLKYGYWYPWALFLLFTMFYFMNKVSNKLLINRDLVVRTEIAIDILIYLSPYLLLIIIYAYVPIQIQEIFSIKELIRLYLFFILGIMMRKYCVFYDFVLHSRLFYTICIIVFCSCLPLVGYGASSSIWEIIFRIPVALSAIFFSFFLASKLPDNRICNQLELMGKKTLDIYLFHFFFLPHFSGNIFTSVLGYNNIIVEIMLLLILLVPIIALCLALSRIIRESPILSSLLLGKSKK